MKLTKKPLLGFVFFFLIIGLSFSDVRTSVDSDIDPATAREAQAIGTLFMDALKRGDYNTAKSVFSYRLAGGGEEMDRYLANLGSQIRLYSFYLAYEYHSLYTGEREQEPPAATVTPPVEEYLSIRNLAFYGDESYSLFYRSDNKGMGRLLFVNLSKDEGSWKISILHLGNFSVEGMPAPQMVDHIMALSQAGDTMSSALYAIALNRILRPGSYLYYRNEGTYTTLSADVISNLQDSQSWPVELEGISIFRFDIEYFDKQGVVPVMYYTTDTALKEGSADREVESLKKDILKVFPELSKNFKHLIARGYNEFPSNPNQQYQYYGSVLNF